MQAAYKFKKEMRELASSITDKATVAWYMSLMPKSLQNIFIDEMVWRHSRPYESKEQAHDRVRSFILSAMPDPANLKDEDLVPTLIYGCFILSNSNRGSRFWMDVMQDSHSPDFKQNIYI
jgi:hypothetical protein